MTETKSISTFAIPNIAQLVSIKKDQHNYLLWLSQFCCTTHLWSFGYCWWEWILSTPTHALLCWQSHPKLNPYFVLWTKKDQFILGWMQLLQRGFWVLSMVSILLNCFWPLFPHGLSHNLRPDSCVAHLKRQLQTLKQESKTCTNYLNLAKQYADQLAAVGKTVDDEDLISYIVSGLHPSSTPFITSFSFATIDHLITFESFQSELLNFEALLSSHTISIPPNSEQFALFSYKSCKSFPTRKNKHFNSYKQILVLLRFSLMALLWIWNTSYTVLALLPISFQFSNFVMTITVTLY